MSWNGLKGALGLAALILCATTIEVSTANSANEWLSGPGFARLASRFTPQINPAPKSGAALASLVLDADLAGTSGRYFPSHTRWREGRSSEASYDPAAAGRLWEASVALSGLAGGESPLVA